MEISMNKIILASGSPRRRELLEQIGIPFEVVTSNAAEVTSAVQPDEIVKELSKIKAEAVKQLCKGKGEAWASQVIEHNGKFYWYVTVEHATIPGKSIGVAVSDSPIGPFKDARGSALITNDMTTQYTSIAWDDIDPTVFIDDDGQAYLFWGNTQCYYAKLKDNMTELDGPIHPINLPRYTEAPWVHKHGDWYYLSFASEFPEKICYAMSKNINGPWIYKGILNEIAGNSNTNHQAIIDFKGKSYFIYHNGSINTDGCGFRRSICIDPLFYQKDGSIKRIQMTTEGIFK